MKRLSVDFNDSVSDEEIQKYATAALTIPGVAKVIIGTEAEARQEAIQNLLWDLFKGQAALIPAASNPKK